MVIPKLTSKNSVLLVMDIQNDFCSPEGILSKKFGVNVKPIHQMLSKLKKFIDEMRRKGVKIIFIKQYEISEGAPSTIKTLFERGKLTPKCLPNSWGSDFYEIQPSEEDIILEKRTWDAFTNLEFPKFLQKNKIKHVIIAGVFTHICVESTARRAFSEGYEVIIPKDLVGINKEKEEHQKCSLEFLDNFVARVINSDDLLKEI
jgi:ureidoacrylate peracid hydrolase